MTTSFYRFRPLNHYTLDELKKLYLYFSTIDGLNDPMEHFYLLFFDENERFYKNFFKHFLSVMRIVSIDSKLSGKEVFKKDLARQVFEFEKDIEILKNTNLDRWIDEHCQNIIDSLTNREVWEDKIKKHLLEIYAQFYRGDDDALKFAKSRVVEYLAQIRKFVISKVVVCCFSKLGNSATLSNEEILMWAHYASGHSGICVEFSDIVESNTNFGDKIEPKPIKYESSKDYIIKNLQFSVGLTLTNSDIDLPQSIVVKDIKNLYDTKYQYIFNTKLDAWIGENEYRITMLKSDLPKQKLKYDFNCLKSITFGVRTPQDRVDEIIKIIKEKCQKYGHKVELYEVKIENGRFVRELYRGGAEMNKTAYIVKIIRDIAIAIVAVLLIVSMVHKDYNGFYLALPIIGSYGGFYATVGINQSYNDKLNIRIDGEVDTNVRHKNSCVKGYSFE